MAEVSLEAVTKMYGKDVGIADVDLTIPDGAFVVLLGPTGAGKTTTLRLIAGLDKPDGGSIKIDGRDVASATPAMRDVAMVFQQYSLYPHLTVRQNLEFPLKSPILKTPQDEIDRKVEDVAEVLRIPHKLNNKATELSGGEMQRVSIGRALVRDPSIYLMDEPLSSLDAKLRSDLRIELKRIHADLGATLLYVTHDQIEAMTMATHVGVLDNGNLVQFGSPREIYENPVSEYVATRLGLPRINLLPANTFDDAPPNAERIGLRPEHITLKKKASAKAREAKINRIEHLGDQTRVHLLLGDQSLITLTDTHTDLTNGSTVHVMAKGGLYFNSSGARIA